MAIPLYLIDYATPQLPKYWAAWYLLTTIQYNINSQYSHGKVNSLKKCIGIQCQWVKIYGL